MSFAYQRLLDKEINELIDLLFSNNTKRKSKAGSFGYFEPESQQGFIDTGGIYDNERL